MRIFLKQRGHRVVAAATLVLTLAAPSRAQGNAAAMATVDSARRLIETGFQLNRVEPIDTALAQLNRTLSASGNDEGVLLHWTGYALYRKAGVLMERKRRDEAKRAFDAADGILERSGRLLPWPETFALRGAVVGQKIGFSSNPLTAMRLGPRANGLMDQAAALAPNNPRVVMIRGIGSLFKPKMFGGGVDKAERDLLRATVLFTNDRPPHSHPSWGEAEAWAFLGVAYQRNGRVADARTALTRALELNPEYHWVRTVLLPELDRTVPK